MICIWPVDSPVSILDGRSVIKPVANVVWQLPLCRREAEERVFGSWNGEGVESKFGMEIIGKSWKF